MTDKTFKALEYITALDEETQEAAETFLTTEAEAARAFSDAIAHLAFVVTEASIPKDRRYIALAAYASRVIQHALGAYRLVQMGNTISAEVVERATLEAAFAVGALANEENFEDGRDFYLRLLYKSTLGRLKPLQEFIESNVTLSTEDQARGEQTVAELHAQLDLLKDHQLRKTSALAQAANMGDYYKREYASQSRVFHSDLEVVIADHVFAEGSEIRVSGVKISHAEATLRIANLVAALMETANALTKALKITVPEVEAARFDSIAAFYGKTLEAAAKRG